MSFIEEFRKKNQEERFKFIDFWSEYVRTHDDIDWSKQQNVIINSCLAAAKEMTKEQYLKMHKNVLAAKKQHASCQ